MIFMYIASVSSKKTQHDFKHISINCMEAVTWYFSNTLSGSGSILYCRSHFGRRKNNFSVDLKS